MPALVGCSRALFSCLLAEPIVGLLKSPIFPPVCCLRASAWPHTSVSLRAPSVQVSVVDQLRLPIKFVGVGETQEDLQPFNAETFAEALFPKKEQ